MEGPPEGLPHQALRPPAPVGVDEGGGGGGVEALKPQRLVPGGEDDGLAQSGHRRADDSRPLGAIELGPPLEGIEDAGGRLVIIDEDVAVLGRMDETRRRLRR